MSSLIRILIGLGIVFALLIAIVLVVGNLGDATPETQALSISLGNRTVTVAVHYKDLTQESRADGVKVVVDGHEVSLTDDQLMVDGKAQVLEPDKDVEIYVYKDGKVEVKVVEEKAAAPE